MSFYWNSESETFIPNSVWESSLDLHYGVFELIEADIIHEMMKDIFQSKAGIQNNFILDPFSLRIQFGLRNYYNLNVDDYKYRVAIENEKLRIKMRPEIEVIVTPISGENNIPSPILRTIAPAANAKTAAIGSQI